ncbi:MAG: GlxA family transcriptional regulator [Wenzhouxiangellaceae bacterium]
MMLTYDQAQALDTVGPLEVFALASQQLIDDGLRQTPAYEIRVVGPQKGSIAFSSGIRLLVDNAITEAPPACDTLIVSGGMGHCMEAVRQQPQLVAWLQNYQHQCRRLASICNGALLLAECGILNHRRATTHWLDVAELKTRYARVMVNEDAIYVQDGKVWTSAGISAGMDLALALVSADYDHDLALKVAKRMVLFGKRAGGQRQFSNFLAQQRHSERFAGLLSWLHEHFTSALSLEQMAQRCHMSTRHFTRCFQQEIGATPMRYLEGLRLEAAKNLLEQSGSSLQKVARHAGFNSEEALRRAFVKRFNVTPLAYRQHFNRNQPSP